RPGPVFIDARSAGAGAAYLLTTSVLALLGRRARTGVGGWSETSLYDGMLATLGTMVGRSERAPVEVERYWAKGSTFPNSLCRCPVRAAPRRAARARLLRLPRRTVGSAGARRSGRRRDQGRAAGG